MNSVHNTAPESLTFSRTPCFLVYDSDEYKEYKTHWHNAVEIIMPTENVFPVVCENNQYTLKENNILIIPAGHLHNLKAQKGRRIIMLCDNMMLKDNPALGEINMLLSEPILIDNSYNSERQKSAKEAREKHDYEGKSKKDMASFDLDLLRWNKIVICTDADVDGFQIRTLILTMIYRLCPTLIRDGYVYIAESPLFEITCKDKTWFAYNEPEKAKILKELEGQKVKIQRSKGLGENDPEMMWMTTMNPETRRLIKVMPEEAERTSYYFDVLLGDSLNERKNFIAENGAKYLELADIS